MSQLHQFINTLGDYELNALKEMRLIGKEADLFNYTLKHIHKNIPDVTKVCADTGITATHLYKINSVLLNKCYTKLVHEGSFTLLNYLKSKGLFVLLRSEANTQEKQLIKNKTSAPELERFYLSLFHLYIDFPYKYYDKKSIENIGKKYVSVKKDTSESDKLYVTYHILFSEINKYAAQKNPMKAFGKTDKDLLKYENELEETKHYLARYYLYRSIISYYTYYEKDSTKIEEYLKKCLALKDKIQFFFPINIGQFLNLIYADHLFSNQRIDEAWSIFQKEFENGVSENIYGYHYHCEQYILLSIIKKEFDKAETLLNKFFKQLIELRADILATRGCLCYIKYYLTHGDLKQVSYYINIARGINEKALYLPFDLQLRLLENLYFYLKGDHEFAYRLANRNMKFVQSQKNKKLLSDYFILFKVLAMYSQLKREKIKAPDAALVKEQGRIATQYRNLYCDLLMNL